MSAHKRYSSFRRALAAPIRALLAPILHKHEQQREQQIEALHAELQEIIRIFWQRERLRQTNSHALNIMISELFFARFRDKWNREGKREDYFSRFLLLQCDSRDLIPCWGVNLGDYVQAHAVIGMMQKIAPEIPKAFTERDNLSCYEGEKAFTIMQGWFSHGIHFFPNDRIWPVYVGFHVTRETQDTIISFLRYNPDYFKGHSIGCRDHETLEFCQRIGLNAYLSRCLTLTFPKRQHTPKHKKVFLVDIPPHIMELIPAHIRENAEVIIQKRSQEYGWDRSGYYNTAERYVKMGGDLLARYRDEATLIVTTALHCASPCTAMGIPVVLLNIGGDETTRRFDFIRDILPIWNMEALSAGSVNWEPQVPDIEELKRDMELNLRLSIEEERTGVASEELLAVRHRLSLPV